MSNEHRVTTRLPAEMVEQLRQLSDLRGDSMSKIIRDVLQRYLNRQF